MIERMKRVAAAESPPIHMSYGGTIGNTLDSHRLIGWAAEKPKGVQDAIVEALFKAYFEEEKNIADRNVIEEAIERAIPEDAEMRASALDFISSDAAVKETVEEAEQIRRSYGVSGVPFFVIQDKYAVSGAQESDAFVRLFDKVFKENGGATTTLGDSCSLDNPDGC